MRGFVLEGFGEPGSVSEVPDPEPEAGEVLVRVRAAGVNAVDPWVTAGALKEMMEHRFPLIPGIDASGVVEAVGPGVDRYSVGDEVYGVAAKPFYGAGTFAELASLPTSAIGPKPASVDHVRAAAVPHAGLTALAVLDALDPKEDDVLLIVGATGGVGSYLTQLASRRGARVVAVARSKNAEYARSLGASEIIDHTAGDLAELVRAGHPDGVDGLAALFGDASLVARLSEVVRPGGRVVSTLGAVDAEALAKSGRQGVNANRADPARLSELTALVDRGELRVPDPRVFPLEATGEALAEIGGGHVRGKLVISPEAG